MKLAALGLSVLGIGVSDQPNGAAPLAQKVPGIDFRYQYLTGGLGDSGWSHWNPNGQFVSLYVRESVKAGITPVFTYYQALSASPIGARPPGEDTADIATLKSAATMKRYYADLALAMRRAKAAANGRLVVFHIEPDLWGYLMQHGERGLARRFAKRVIAIRNGIAPKTIALGWHLSVWGAKEDPTYSDPSVAHMRGLGRKLARWYRSLHARFDVVFTDVEDRDAGFNEHVNGDGGASAWSAVDFRNYQAMFAAFTKAAKRKLVVWQVPLGNSTLDDTWDHFRDNRVEGWLGNPNRLRGLRRAGVKALLYGGGADGTTQKETDGGLFYRLAGQYYARAGR
jgi:hypothetical protein